MPSTTHEQKKGPEDQAVKEILPAPPGHHKHDPNPPGATATAIGHWIHNHKTITDTNPVGYTVYQVIRSALACIPYGVSMATTWFGFEKAARFGTKLSETASSPVAKEFGYRLAQFTSSRPVRTSAMVATSFSLYRGTSKIGKWVNESLFNPKDTEEQTIKEVQQLPGAVWGKIKEVMPAELASTPVAAVVLGFVTSVFDPTKVPKEFIGSKAGMQAAMKEGKGLEYFGKVVFSRPSRFVEQAAINSIGYSLFFELGDRRFKDKQISRGLWGGDSHSIGSQSKSSPSLLSDPPIDGNLKKGDTFSYDFADPEERHTKAPVASPHDSDKLSLLTSEPSSVRFLFRRVVPTAIAITGYTAFKFRGAPMFLGPMAEGLETVKDLPRASWREGAATTLFFMIPFVTDKYVKWYDNLVNGLEERISGKKIEDKGIHEKVLPPEDGHRVKKNYEDLRRALDEKEHGTSLAHAR